MSAKRNGLGRGLDAIFMDNDLGSGADPVKINISEIEPNREQPRKNFSSESISELAESIARHGIIQPLIVRPCEGGYYQIVAGERRWRACKMAGITEAPVIIKDLSDAEVMELALIENLQREDLSPVEEAKGYMVLMDTYGFNQEEVSKSVGKSRSSVANSLRLLSLPDKLLNMLEDNKITTGHAKVLLSFKDQDKAIEAAELVYKQGLSVRNLEKLCKVANNGSDSDVIKEKKRNGFYDEVELSLRDYLGRKVKITEIGGKKGTLQIEFYSEDDLSELARLIGG